LEPDGLARALHLESGRSAEPLLTLDCAALRESEAGAALFGGTLDAQRHPGALRVASSGTLLLADVAALPRPVQRQLAAALASRTAHTIDGRESYAVTARIVATCPVGLLPSSSAAEAPDAAGFDGELHARFAPAELRVPPLRERLEDIESLTLLAVDRACRRLGRPAVGVAKEAIAALKAHTFSGNLAELEDLMQRAVVTCRGERIDVAALRLGEHSTTQADGLEGTLEEIEKRALEAALSRSVGNKSEAARLLGLPRTTFLDKLRRYKLDDGTRDSQLPPN
jgi:DNA-binding NtrC family response regulator